MSELASRRPLASRDKAWARSFARFLRERGVHPNTISVFSVVFAALGALGFLLSGTPEHSAAWRGTALLVAVLGIFGRLLCNLFDGMVAVEGGMKTATGEIYNDLPDRLSDVALFVSAGIAAGHAQLGWAAACLAVLTAYIRYLGAGCGVGHFFIGPMAKQQRMGTLIAASVGSIALEPHFLAPGTLLMAALAAVVLGSVVTSVRRVRRIAAALRRSA